MLNNINKEMSGDNIVIKLLRQNDNYSYLSDNMTQDLSKIKILIEPNQKKEKTFIFTKKTAAQTYVPPFAVTNIKDESEAEMDPNIEPEVVEMIQQLEQPTKQMVIIPACSHWFSFSEIHEIEVNALPEYFCKKYPSKTPYTYRESRNFIISLYRENPTSYLSSTSKSSD